MKKLFLSLFALALIQQAGAQEILTPEVPLVEPTPNDKKFRFGISVSPNISWFKADSKNIAGDGAKAGIALGLVGDFHFTKNYAFNVELLHVTSGGKIKADSVSYQSNKVGDVVFNYSFRSFQLPLSLKLRTNEIGYITYWGQLGVSPSIAYRSRADIKPADRLFFNDPEQGQDREVNSSDNDYDYLGAPGITDENRRHFFEEDNTVSFRMPMLIGAGIEYNISGSTSIVAGLRYENGFFNIFKADGTRGYSHTLSLNAGILF